MYRAPLIGEAIEYCKSVYVRGMPYLRPFYGTYAIRDAACKYCHTSTMEPRGTSGGAVSATEPVGAIGIGDIATPLRNHRSPGDNGMKIFRSRLSIAQGRDVTDRCGITDSRGVLSPRMLYGTCTTNTALVCATKSLGVAAEANKQVALQPTVRVGSERTACGRIGWRGVGG